MSAKKRRPRPPSLIGSITFTSNVATKDLAAVDLTPVIREIQRKAWAKIPDREAYVAPAREQARRFVYWANVEVPLKRLATYEAVCQGILGFPADARRRIAERMLQLIADARGNLERDHRSTWQLVEIERLARKGN